MGAKVEFGKMKGNLTTEAYGNVCLYEKKDTQRVRKVKGADKGDVAVGKRMGTMPLANIAVVYKQLLPLLEETMSMGKEERRDEFKRQNMKYCHFALTPEELDRGAGIVNEYVVSKGKLQPIEIDEWGTSSIALPGIEKLDRFMKKGDVCKAILEGNEDWREQDVLVYVRLRQMLLTEGDVPVLEGAMIKMVMDVTDEEILGMEWPQDSMGVTDGKMSYSGGNEAVGYCWIHLRPAEKAEVFGLEQYGDASTQQLKITNMREIQAKYRTVERVKMAVAAWEKRRQEKKEKPREKANKTVEEMVKGW